MRYLCFALIVIVGGGVALTGLAGCGPTPLEERKQVSDEIAREQPAPSEQPKAASSAPSGSVQIPANAKAVYSLPLSKDGQPAIYRTRSIEGARIARGVLELKTTTADGNFDLYPDVLAQGLKPPLWLKVEMSNTVSGSWGQIYWDTGMGATEKTAARWELSGDGAMHKYELSLSADGPVLDLRFDPSGKVDTVRIKALEIYSGG